MQVTVPARPVPAPSRTVTSGVKKAPTLRGWDSRSPVVSHTCSPPPGQTSLPPAPFSSSLMTTNSRSPTVTGSIWWCRVTAGSVMTEMIDGFAGSVVSMMIDWSIAAEYARVPSALKVMSWLSWPVFSFITSRMSDRSEMSTTSMQLPQPLELELYM